MYSKQRQLLETLRVACCCLGFLISLFPPESFPTLLVFFNKKIRTSYLSRSENLQRPLMLIRWLCVKFRAACLSYFSTWTASSICSFLLFPKFHTLSTRIFLFLFEPSVICELERDANAPFTPVSNSTKLPFNIGKKHPFLGNGRRQQVSATICCRWPLPSRLS